MVTYPSFEDAFDDPFKGVNEWKEDFSKMTYEEFDQFFEYVFLQRINELMDAAEKPSLGYMLVRFPMMVAICSKLLEAAHFCDGVPQNWREATDRVAQLWFDWLLSILGHTKQGLAAKAAWDAQREKSDRFGYKTGAVFEVLAPHSVFS